jgi:hypothetical protein
MKQFRAVSFLKWIMVGASTFTLLTSPVAMGAEAKRLSKAQLQQTIEKMGLNQSITMGEFYEKNKHLMSQLVQNELEPVFMANKNVKMPDVEVTSSKNTLGEEVPTIRLSQEGELVNVQWFGERNKLAKIQNTTLNETDVVNFNDIIVRLSAADEKFRKQLDSGKPPKAYKSVKYPDVSRLEWMSMSAYDKANYIVNLRLLWEDSVKVLAAKEKLAPAKGKKQKKTSQNFFEQNKYFFALLTGFEAEAVEGIVIGGGTAGTPTDDNSRSVTDSNATLSGQYCIVAGYVARYKPGSRICDKNTIDATYSNRNNNMYSKSKEVCSASNQIACNPYIYGFKADGTPNCVSPDISSTSPFQTASHWNGLCESGTNKLSVSEVQILRDTTKSRGRYEDGNLKSEAERREAVRAEQETGQYALTDKYLLSILKFNGKAADKTNSIFEGTFTDEMLEQVKISKGIFDNEIKAASDTCAYESQKSVSADRRPEKNYWGACDQLQRRFLFVTELFAKKCGGADKLDETSLKCKCPPSGALVLPGAACSAAPPSGDATISSPVSGPIAPAACEYAAVPGIGANCKCSNGASPTLQATDSTSGSQSYACGPVERPDRDGKKKSSCGLLCGLGKFAVKALPYVVAAGVVYAVYKLTAPKVPKLTPAADLCPGSTTLTAPCVQACAAPFAQLPTGCGCPSCVGTLDVTTCNCSGTSTSTTNTTYICPDLSSVSAPAGTDYLALCKDYSCPGSTTTVKNPINCPPQSAVSPTNTTPIVTPVGSGR